MADLSTTYMGLSLRTPLVLASSSLSNKVENFQAAEAGGAGAVVLRSLFEEQIEAAQSALEEELSRGAESNPEARSYMPPQRIGPHEYLRLVERAKKAVKVPVIASLNCTAPGSWSEYAAQLERAGADALEVNIYSVGADASLSGEELERQYLEIVRSVKESVKVPVALKLSPFFTSLTNAAARFDQAGVKGLVLFNRFLQPDIDRFRLWRHRVRGVPGAGDPTSPEMCSASSPLARPTPSRSARLIPSGHFAPADFNETVNTLGQPLYAKQEPRKFERGTDLHTQSNPLPMCHRPGVLVKLTMS